VIGLLFAWPLGRSGRIRRGDVIAALQVALEEGECVEDAVAIVAYLLRLEVRGGREWR